MPWSAAMSHSVSPGLTVTVTVSGLPFAPPDDSGVCDDTGCVPALPPVAALRAAVIAADQATDAWPPQLESAADWALEDWALAMAPVSTTYTIATSPTPRSSGMPASSPLEPPHASGKRQRPPVSAVCCRRPSGLRRYRR